MREVTESAIAAILAVALILLTVTYYSGALVQLIATAFDKVPQ